MRRLIIGCGYLGGRVARSWCARGDDVLALTRSRDHARTLEREGVQPIVGNVLDVETLKHLPVADTVLYAVGYDRSAPASKREVYVAGLRNVLDELPPNSGRLIYISSTSVYGHSGGEWIDESSPCQPTSEGGQICRDAEIIARERFSGQRGVSVLRLSGIYGPQRLAARVESLRQQRKIAGDPDGWLNLIHVDDARSSVLTCADMEVPSDTLLVSDNEPLKRRDYYARLCAAIKAPLPVFADATAAGVDSRDLGKRCSNRRLHNELGIELAYPTLTQGLPTAIEADSAFTRH